MNLIVADTEGNFMKNVMEAEEMHRMEWKVVAETPKSFLESTSAVPTFTKNETCRQPYPRNYGVPVHRSYKMIDVQIYWKWDPWNWLYQPPIKTILTALISCFRFRYMMILFRRSTRISFSSPNSWNCLACSESRKIFSKNMSILDNECTFSNYNKNWNQIN